MFCNSGGPVFDENGALVAISVAGMMNGQGNSLNINYLIPLESALEFLKIKTDTNGNFETASSNWIGNTRQMRQQ